MKKISSPLNNFKHALVYSIITAFLASNICYAQPLQLRTPIGNFERQEEVQRKAGSTIRLCGGALDDESARHFEDEFKRIVSKSIGKRRGPNRAWTIFEDREPLKDTDYPITRYKPTKFFKALRERANTLPEEFDVVILKTKEGLPIDVMLRPGLEHNQAYIAYSTIKTLEEMYRKLEDGYKTAFIDIILEAFKHEAEHIKLRGSFETKSLFEIERHVNAIAPSFRAIELFRLVYLTQKLKDEPLLQPDINKFFKNLTRVKNKESYLFAYIEDIEHPETITQADLKKHLQIAEKLVPLPKTKYRVPDIDTILAQHHIGLVLVFSLKKPEDAESELFQSAVHFLKEKGIIDTGPETEELYPLYKFVRELIFSNIIATNERDFKNMIVLLNLLNELNPCKRASQTEAGKIVHYPKSGETITLGITLDQAKEVISKKGLKPAVKKQIIRRLRTTNEGYVIISHRDMMILGERSYDKAAASTSAAGAGIRARLVMEFDADGIPIFERRAKGASKLDIDGGKSPIEIFLAQIAYRNKKYRLGKNKTPCIIYTSHLTDKDIKGEIERIRRNRRRGSCEP